MPGTLWPWVKRASWVELGIFAALCFFWLAPGFDHQAFIFGWAHGIGFIALCLLIWIAILRHEAPYTLLAATLTPVGPLGQRDRDRGHRAQAAQLRTGAPVEPGRARA